LGDDPLVDPASEEMGNANDFQLRISNHIPQLKALSTRLSHPSPDVIQTRVFSLSIFFFLLDLFQDLFNVA